MDAMSMNARVALVVCLFAVTAFGLHGLDRSQAVPLERPLSDFPTEISRWRAVGNETLPENIVEVLGVDDYVSRRYVSPSGDSVHFYASYFETTYGGKGYHSPRNCMPGSGWDVASLEKVPLRIVGGSERSVEVSSMVMQKGADKELVLYWYQGRGRIMATEYSERIYRVIDSLFEGRTDGAFIRIIASADSGDIAESRRTALNFAAEVIPVLDGYLPK